MTKAKAFESRLLLYTLSIVLPLYILCLALMIAAALSVWLILLYLFISSLGIALVCYSIASSVNFQFRSLSNLLAAMKAGDYSMRAGPDRQGSALNELIGAINELAETLNQQRRQAKESELLLKSVIEYVDIAILATDAKGEIQFCNHCAQELLTIDNEQQRGTLRQQLKDLCGLKNSEERVISIKTRQGAVRHSVYAEEFRHEGVTHKLLFIKNVTQLLRSEEKRAWQSLVKVLSHEINNSLTPIASISRTLINELEKAGPQINRSSSENTLLKGLNVMEERAINLKRFIQSYQTLTRLPEPQRQPCDLANLVTSVTMLFEQSNINVVPCPNPIVAIDAGQIKQVLINLIKNAIESHRELEREVQVVVSIEQESEDVTIVIDDHGSGLGNSENLFTPFYSTKKGGSGIGLVLSREIAEAHGGSLSLKNKRSGTGCRAVLTLPV